MKKIEHDYIKDAKWSLLFTNLKRGTDGSLDVSGTITGLYPAGYRTPDIVSFTCDLQKQFHKMLNDKHDMTRAYIENDIRVTKELCDNAKFIIKNVIFNDPATIVFWMDGSKTVVKCQEGDIYDPEKGLAMAIAKKVYGNKGAYNNQINKWVDKYKEAEELRKTALSLLPGTPLFPNSVSESLRKLSKSLSKQIMPMDVKEDIQNAYNVLHKALNSYTKPYTPRCTKASLVEAIEEALGYLGEALDK